MRNVPNVKADRYRDRDDPLMGSTSAHGNNGRFIIKRPGLPNLVCVVSDGMGPECLGWEHVSVSTAHRTPTWEEMCLVKRLFWRDDETVIQFHPPDAAYVNDHDHVLHLWRNLEAGDHPLPPSCLVGHGRCPSTPAGKVEIQSL